jgi:hypothetical protein
MVLSAVSATLGGDKKPSRYFSPELEKLEAFYGEWKVTVHHYDARGERVATVEGKEQVGWILNDHAIRREYQTGQGADSYQALGMLTWNEAKKRYQGVWFDTVSATGPTSVTGEWDEDTQSFTFQAETLGKDGSTIRYKVEDRLLESEKRIATTYLVSGDRLTRVLETHYKRATPCPGKFRSMDAIPP